MLRLGKFWVPKHEAEAMGRHEAEAMGRLTDLVLDASLPKHKKTRALFLSRFNRGDPNIKIEIFGRLSALLSLYAKFQTL